MQDDKNAIFQMRFPQKLWYLLNLRTDAILWGGTGRTILLNYHVLHNYLQCGHSVFKTTNISSFVRQLNLYGFRKVTSHLQDPLCNSSNPYMHEYVHDFFQYGRPELLNKITRKALTMKKTFKPKSLLLSNPDQLLHVTPLQKARRALRVALRKAAQDLFIHNSPKRSFNIEFESEDTPEDFCEEENLEFDWLIEKNANATIPTAKTQENDDKDMGQSSNYSKTPEVSQEIMNFKDCQQHEKFPSQFLNMPDLDDGAGKSHSSVELLAEFDIRHDCHDGIMRKMEVDNENDLNSLNCVLPCFNNDNADFSIAEKNVDDLDQYNGEWDQMFSDIMTNKVPAQDCSSDLKDLYSQISRTIGLLNA